MSRVPAAFLLALGACGEAPSPEQVASAGRARTLIEGNADGLVFYSLSSVPFPPGGPERPKLHGWTILNRAAVKDTAMAARIRQTLSDPTTYDTRAVPCFRPGLAFTFEGPRPSDFVICLECRRIDAFHDGRPVESLLLSDAGVVRLTGIHEALSRP